jgi:hypothetical protein
MAMTLRTARMHPALHVDSERILVGRVTDDGLDYQLVDSDRKIVSAGDVEDDLIFVPRPYQDLAGRWPGDDVTAFLAGAEAPTFSEILALATSAFDEALDFPRNQLRTLLAVWAVASYFHPCFLTFPRLNFSGEKGSGKSKAISLLRATAFNALYLISPTPAVLYRLIAMYKPSMLLDEVEGLATEDGRDVLAVINSGYKAGGSVPRCEGDKRRVVELYSVYSPLALAAIKNVNAVTEDRCIPVVMQRGLDQDKLNREIDLAALEYGQIRSGCYRLLLTHWRQIREEYGHVTLPAWLNARARELWKPLLTIASLADRDNGLKITDDLLSLAKDHVEARDGTSSEAEALLAILGALIDGTVTGEIVARPSELREPLRDRLGWRDAPSAESVGAWLRRLGIERKGKDRLGAKYLVTNIQLKDIRKRYGLDEVTA